MILADIVGSGYCSLICMHRVIEFECVPSEILTSTSHSPTDSLLSYHHHHHHHPCPDHQHLRQLLRHGSRTGPSPTASGHLGRATGVPSSPFLPHCGMETHNPISSYPTLPCRHSVTIKSFHSGSMQFAKAYSQLGFESSYREGTIDHREVV